MDGYLDTESVINGSSGAFVEDLFARYTKDPDSVDSSWATYFAGLAEDARALLNAGVNKPAASWERPDWDHKVKSVEDDYISALDPGHIDLSPTVKRKAAATEDEIWRPIAGAFFDPDASCSTSRKFPQPGSSFKPS